MSVGEIIEFLTRKPELRKFKSGALKDYLLREGFKYITKRACSIALQDLNSTKGKVKQLEPVKPKVLIYDIETSPNVGWFWRAGYKQNIGPNQILEERKIICLSYKWAGEDEVYSLNWDTEQDDKFLLEQFIPVLNESDLIVAHNGDRFDIKWIRTRALYHRLEMLPKYKQFDTLKVAKSKLYLNSNRLDYIAKFLGFEGKLVTRHNLWGEVCFDNNRDSLVEMIEYCEEDVVQLEHVYNELKHLDNPRLHVGRLNDRPRSTSPISGTYNAEVIKQIATTAGTIKYIMRDLETGRFFEMSESNYKKFHNLK